MTPRAEGNSDKLAKIRARLDGYVARLSQRGIDAEPLLPQPDEEREKALRDSAELVWKQMCSDAATILAGGVSESCLVVCRVCGERKSTITDFRRYYDMNGKPIKNRTCRSCRNEEQLKYTDRNREVIALRKRLADIEMPTSKCSRCHEKKQPILFPSGGRVCLQCRVEIADSLVQSLRERLSCEAGNTRVDVRRRQARGEYAGKRLQQAINQSDGTLSVEVIGRLFAEAEGKPCPYCGDYMSRATKSLDHMVPLGKGGVHGVVNLIICCTRCNSAKRDRDFADWISKLKEPYASVMAAEYEQRYGAKASQSQLPFQYATISTPAAIQ
jgi:5-methylcytosine-specific restriction endonuclease McrA